MFLTRMFMSNVLLLVFYFFNSETAFSFESKSCIALSVNDFKPETVKLEKDGSYQPKNNLIWVFTALKGGTKDNIIRHLWERNKIHVDSVSRKVMYNRGHYTHKHLSDERYDGHWILHILDEHDTELSRIELDVRRNGNHMIVHPTSKDATVCPADDNFLAAKAEVKEKVEKVEKVEPKEIFLTKPLEKTAPTKENKKIFLKIMDLNLFAGLSNANLLLGKNVKRTASYGAGISKDFEINETRGVTFGLYGSHKLLKPRSSELSGSVQLNDLLFRGDYRFIFGSWQPFIGLGVGAFFWSGEITQKISQAKNKGHDSNFGAFITPGILYKINNQFSIISEISAFRVTGTLRSSYETINLMMRMGI